MVVAEKEFGRRQRHEQAKISRMGNNLPTTNNINISTNEHSFSPPRHFHGTFSIFTCSLLGLLRPLHRLTTTYHISKSKSPPNFPRAMTGRGGGGAGRKTLLAPIHFIFKLLQQRSVVSIWLYEQLAIRIEGKIRVRFSFSYRSYLPVLLNMSRFQDTNINIYKKKGIRRVYEPGRR